MKEKNRIIESESLIRLKSFLENRKFKGLIGIDRKKIGIRCTKDVVEYIKNSSELQIDIVGFDYKDNPIYSRVIRIIEVKK